MSIKKFKDVTYDLSTTEGYLCNTITTITATTGEAVSAIEVFNNIIVNPSEPARPLTATNVNATIDDISSELNSKVPNGRTVNNKALSSDIVLKYSDVDAEQAFNKNSAFNKNFGSDSNSVCKGDDFRLSDSRKCNNTFGNAAVAKTNLGLHSVASSGKYNDLTDQPYIPNEYDYFPGIFKAAVAGFSNLSRLSSNSSAMTKTLNYRKKYCFIGYGSYTASYMYSISGGVWQGAELDFASNFVVIPIYAGSMAGSEKVFNFITSDGIYYYRTSPSSAVDITVSLNRPDTYAYSEVTLYNY